MWLWVALCPALRGLWPLFLLSTFCFLLSLRGSFARPFDRGCWTLPDFLADIFCGLLDYTGPVGPADPHNSHNSHTSHLSGTGPAESPDTFNFSRERHVQVHGKVADAVLGRFQKHKAQFVMGPMPA